MVNETHVKLKQFGSHYSDITTIELNKPKLFSYLLKWYSHLTAPLTYNEKRNRISIFLMETFIYVKELNVT